MENAPDLLCSNQAHMMACLARWVLLNVGREHWQTYIEDQANGRKGDVLRSWLPVQKQFGGGFKRARYNAAKGQEYGETLRAHMTREFHVIKKQRQEEREQQAKQKIIDDNHHHEKTLKHLNSLQDRQTA